MGRAAFARATTAHLFDDGDEEDEDDDAEHDDGHDDDARVRAMTTDSVIFSVSFRARAASSGALWCAESRGIGFFLDFFGFYDGADAFEKRVFHGGTQVHTEYIVSMSTDNIARSHFANRGVGGSSPSPTRPPPPADDEEDEDKEARVNSSANARAALTNASARNPPAASPPSRFATDASVPFDANALAARSKNFAADAAAASSSIPRNGHASPNAADEVVHDDDDDHVDDAPNARSGPPSSRNVSVVRSNSSSGLRTRTRS